VNVERMLRPVSGLSAPRVGAGVEHVEQHIRSAPSTDKKPTGMLRRCENRGQQLSKKPKVNRPPTIQSGPPQPRQVAEIKGDDGQSAPLVFSADYEVLRPFRARATTLLERICALAGVFRDRREPPPLTRLHRYDRRAKSTSVARACERALGCTALWVSDPRIRVVEVLEGADWCMMVYPAVMAEIERTVRQSVSIPAGIAKRVRTLAKTRKTSANRVLVDLIEAGLQSKEAEKERFFSLVSRLTESSDPSERERLKEELARMTFGS
jgi:hypothetical protein